MFETVMSLIEMGFGDVAGQPDCMAILVNDRNEIYDRLLNLGFVPDKDGYDKDGYTNGKIHLYILTPVSDIRLLN